MPDAIPVPTVKWNCMHCDKHCERPPTKGQRPKFCSKKCRLAHSKPCEECGVNRIRPDGRWCGPCATAVRLRVSLQPPRVPPPSMSQCAWCHALHLRASVHCSAECRQSAARARRSALRAAYEDCDYPRLLEAIEQRAVKQASGCWVWPRIRDGYPTQNIGGKWVAVHRVVLEAKHSAPLGTQAAHHICANTTCVNPEHLQPVTHRENTAEMLARHAYLSRISELESALAAVDPSHPLLNRIKVA